MAIAAILQVLGLDLDNSTVNVLGRDYNLRQIIRLIVIVFGYFLIRPMLLRLSQKLQTEEHEKADAEPIEPYKEDGSDEEDESWGAKIRRRQRAEAKAMEAERRKEVGEGNESDDEELEKLLE